MEAEEQMVAPEKEKKRPFRKTVLAALVTGVVTVGALSVIRFGLIDGATDEPLVIGPGGLSIGGTGAQALATDPNGGSHNLPARPSAPAYGLIKRKVDTLSEQVDSGFRGLQADRSAMKETLSEMAEGIRAIQTSVKGLYAVSEAIEQRVTNTQSRLDTVTQAVRALKVVKKNAPKKKQPPVISKPPFHIDAIDLWDDVTYVAISQSGRAAFLKAGEQQAGWAVTRIDRLKGEVGFRGPAGQAYLASLGR